MDVIGLPLIRVCFAKPTEQWNQRLQLEGILDHLIFSVPYNPFLNISTDGVLTPLLSGGLAVGLSLLLTELISF